MKIIVTDLDGTLLKSDKTISDYTSDIFNKCRDKGHMIVFATARAENAMKRFIDKIKPDAIISSGGALVTLKGKHIYSNLLSSADVSKIVKKYIEYTKGNGRITLESVDGYFCNFTPDDTDRLTAFKYNDFTDFSVPCYKITAEFENEKLIEDILNDCEDCSVIKYTGEKWHRFASKASTKEFALRQLLNNSNLEYSDVIAFGDDVNDLGMMKVSGTSVAPSNAIEEIKSLADYITDDNDHDGVAKFLENTLLYNQ